MLIFYAGHIFEQEVTQDKKKAGKHGNAPSLYHTKDPQQ